MTRLATATVFLLAASAAFALPGLPADADFDSAVPTPSEVLGFEPGEHHPRHDEIVAYLRALAAASDRVVIEEIGRTHGRRPLMLLTFARPDRLGRVDEIRTNRKQASRNGEGPLVVWLGYSVHGNEASGSSAALVTAWYLAASRDEQVERWLDDMVIVMEPAINPDGIDRFAHWVNTYRGRNPSADPDDREHNEVWPAGRTNYYWFDLNRDWLPLVHPESRSRMSQYHDWRPHVLTDHHEMGRNSTFFFQPGVPERKNPLTPEGNVELTEAIAEFHARALDSAGEPYYSEESFDDFYPGKGSTYPDLTGGVGILFEQSSSRGHVQDSDYGTRRFADGVANQVRTSLSTLAGARAHADRLIDYQREFFAGARDEARRNRQAGWVLGDDGDPARAHALIELLLGHDLAVHPVNGQVEIQGRQYGPGSAWVIPFEQDHYRLLRSVFEAETELDVDTFYDVSAWPLAMSHHLPVERVRRLPDHGEGLLTPPVSAYPAPPAEAPAWLVPWDQYRADAVLAALLADGYRVQASTDVLTAATTDGARELVRGSLIVHSGIQPDNLADVGARLTDLADRHGIEVLAAQTGRSRDGVDLGSPSAPVIEPMRPALLTGNGVSSYHAGYIWHWFDMRLEQPVAQIDVDGLTRLDLSEYTHLIVPEGRYRSLAGKAAEKIAEFVRNGGVLLALRGASDWAEELDLGWSFAQDEDGESDNGSEESDEAPPERRPYADHRQDSARELIGGSALRVDLDITHPLAFGYRDAELVLFRRGRHVLKPGDNHYTRVAVYADPPLAAGYLSDDNRQRLTGTPAISVTRHGSGAVVRMADDVLFRGYWRGGEKLFANALFFSRLVGTTRLPGEEG